MTDDLYRSVFSAKLKYYMSKSGKNQTDLMRDLNLSSSTVSSWCTGQKLPRMGKIQMLADYFGINKSDLIEEDSPEDPDGTVLDFVNGIDPFLLELTGNLPDAQKIQEMIDQGRISQARDYLLKLQNTGNEILSYKLSDADPQIEEIVRKCDGLTAYALEKVKTYIDDLRYNPESTKQKPPVND